MLDTHDDLHCEHCGKTMTCDDARDSRDGKQVICSKCQRIEVINRELSSLVAEYFELVAPTKQEIINCGEILQGDGDEILLDSESTLGQIYLADQTLSFRKETSNANPE